MSEQNLATKSDSTVRAAATTQQKNARSKVRMIRTMAAASNLQASSTIEASSSAKEIEDAIDHADTKFNEGKYGEALNTFQATIRAAQAVEVNLDAENRLGKNVQSDESRAGSGK